MAVERIKEFTIDLGDIIKTRLESFVGVRENILARQESEFQIRVMDEDLSLEEQSKFREKQLADEKAKTYPYLEFVVELNNTISSLKKLMRHEKRRNKYFDMFSDYNLGKASTDTMIKFLEDQIATTNDTKTIEELQKDLLGLRTAKATEEMTILNNKIKLFEKDKSLDLYDELITTIKTKRSEALAVGNLDLVSSYDVTLTSLKSQKTHIVIEDKLVDFEFTAMREGWESSEKLNNLNTLVSQADEQNEMSINGVRFSSEREYWENQRNAYIAGAGSGIISDFFSEFSTEKENEIIKYSALGKFQAVPSSYLHSLNNEYKSLAAKPEFAPYLNKIEIYRLSNLTKGLSTTIAGLFDEAKAFSKWSEAETAIQKLQAEFGIDLSSALLGLKEEQITFYKGEPEETLRELAVLRAAEEGISLQEAYEKFGLKVEPGVAEEIVPTPEPTIPTPEPPTPTPAIPEITPGMPLPKVGEFGMMDGKKYQWTETGWKLAEITPVTPPTPTPPTPTPPTPTPPTPETYTVEVGETLWGISQRLLGSGARWRELKTPEGVAFTEETAKRLQIGQKLIVPPK